MKTLLLCLALSTAAFAQADSTQRAAVVAKDTLISRTDLIRSFRSELDAVQKAGSERTLVLQAQIRLLEAMTDEKIRVKK